MADVVIFGTRDFASLAHSYLRREGEHRVVAFTVHRAFLPETPTFEGLPVVPCEELDRRYPPGQVWAFAPMSHRKMNTLRAAVYNELRGRGYRLLTYVSPRAATFPDLQIGDNCFVLEQAILQPFVKIGANVMIWSGAHVGHHSTVEDHAFLAPCAAVSGHCTIGRSAFLGIHSTVRDRVRVAEGTLVGMGAIVARDTQPYSVYRAAATPAAADRSLDLDF